MYNLQKNHGLYDNAYVKKRKRGVSVYVISEKKRNIAGRF